MHRLPSSMASLFRPLEPFSKPLFLAGVKDLLTPRKKCDDDSVYDFAARRFGEDVAKFAVDPMVRGICSGDARKISAASFVTGPMFRHEQESGGVFRGVLRNMLIPNSRKDGKKEEGELCELAKRAREEKWSVWSLKGGLETLVDTLVNRLVSDGVQVRTGVRAQEVSNQKSGGMAVAFQEGPAETFDHVFLACPSHAASTLLEGASSEAASLLRDIPFVTVAVVSVEFPVGPDCHSHAPDGFGFLVPSSQPEPILGVIFDTRSFPQGENRSVYTVMLGGDGYDALFGRMSAEEVERVAVSELRRLLRIEEEPRRVVTRIQRGCIPQYLVGHGARVVGARAAIRDAGLSASLVGCSYDGVGINDAIMSAKRQVMAAQVRSTS